jgi:protein SCO1
MSEEAPPPPSDVITVRPGWPFRRPVFWLSAALLVVALSLFWLTRSPRPEPPVLGQVPTFSLEDQHGEAFPSEKLEKRIWVANFIFTRCPTICPPFTAKMAQIQRRGRFLGERLHLVSFTVDPEHDTPEKLLEYAATHKAAPETWSFLTGPRPELERVIIDGMKVHIQKGSEPDDLMGIGHGSYFVLVDTKMQIRGYYQHSEPASVDQLLRDARLIASLDR